MNHLLNHMMLAFNRSQMNVGYAHLGIITSVNPADYTVKVMLQPEEIETGFIPYCTTSYGWIAPPMGGEQCLVLFERGNNNVPVGALLIFWDGNRAPGVTSPGDTGAGEILLRHSSGSHIKLSSDGKILINGNTEIDVTTPVLKITASQTIDLTSTAATTIQAPTINLKGNVVIDGTLTANNGTITMTNGNIETPDDIIAGGISLKTHRHPDPQGGDTGEPI